MGIGTGVALRICSSVSGTDLVPQLDAVAESTEVAIESDEFVGSWTVSRQSLPSAIFAPALASGEGPADGSGGSCRSSPWPPSPAFPQAVLEKIRTHAAVNPRIAPERPIR